MGRINAEWHRAHRMPKNPTPEQRVAWHREHTQNCNCREMPESIRKLLEAGTGPAPASASHPPAIDRGRRP